MRRLASFIGSSLIIGVAALCVTLLYLRSQALPSAAIAQTSQILDVQGNVIDTPYSGENRQMVALHEISPYAIDATLAVEDHRFYDHFGIDVKGTVRAAVVNFQHMDKVQGASTLTQQLARNLYLNHDRTWSRKIREAVYAAQLELQWSKDKILEMYLNTIYYGHSTYGIQAAAQLFFGKDAKELSLAESALLVGIPKGPKYYSPYLDLDNALDRQKLILRRMVEQGFISEQEAEKAEKEKLVFKPQVKKSTDLAPYFSDYVKHLALDKLGITEQQYAEGGIKVHTTLDLRAQKIAEETVAKHMNNADELQVALIAIDPRNGYIKAMVGGKNYLENQFNRVFADTRQPGSAFKPFVYLTALQQPDFTALTEFKSEPTAFTYDNGKQSYMPSNFGNNYPNDYINLRQAISHSDNIYAIHTIQKVGAEQVIETARKLGISSPMKPLPSLALGTFPVSPYQMAAAFSVIANQGVKVEPVAITRIEDAKGKILYEAPSDHKTKVIEPEYTYVLTNLMESVFDRGGTGSRVAHLLKRPVAGKTGTTNTDAWMVGFTPELTTAVWVGYDRDRNISAVESQKPAPIFAEFTEKTLEPIPPKLFPIPDNVVNVYIDPATGKIATEQCPNSRMEAFVKGTEPQEYCSEHGGQPEGDDKKGNDSKTNKSWWEDLKKWWNN